MGINFSLPPHGHSNAVWEARPLESVRRPVASDAADGPGPREHREVFVRWEAKIDSNIDNIDTY